MLLLNEQSCGWRLLDCTYFLYKNSNSSQRQLCQFFYNIARHQEDLGCNHNHELHEFGLQLKEKKWLTFSFGCIHDSGSNISQQYYCHTKVALQDLLPIEVEIMREIKMRLPRLRNPSNRSDENTTQVILGGNILVMKPTDCTNQVLFKY